MSDPRFTALARDPRYRLPGRKEARTAVDPRFGRLFTDQEFRKKAKVDRYGRKLKPESGKKDLERLYRLDEPDAEAQAEEEEAATSKRVVGSDESDGSDAGLDDGVVTGKRDPAREGGFSDESSDEESSDEDSEDEGEAELAELTAGQEQTEVIPMGEVSRRIAAVNLDWDNLRAVDIMVVASSFAPPGARIESVCIYPSEFGRERLEKEEIEGPPKAIFASSKKPSGTVAEEIEDDFSADDGDDDDESSEDDEEKIRNQLQQDQVDDGEEFDTGKLREYQLERLRYYYAVITCDTEATAQALYEAMDGREYLATANFFDLRFVPDETSFDDDHPRESCTDVPQNYRPNEFKTQALTHSKVRLTWDDDDATRKEVQKRAFSRAEIDENDLQAYIGSDSSDADSVTSRKSAAEDRRAKKKEAQRAKMRAALGLADEPSAKATSKAHDEPVGDMQITFTSGLAAAAPEGKGAVFENAPQESTRERYVRKERERKLKRKEKMKANRTGAAGDDDDAPANAQADAGADNGGDDEGFDDPFFNDPAAAAAAEKKARKAERAKKAAARADNDAEAQSRRAELELLMADDRADGVRHFDMREIEKAQKEARRKAKGKGKKRDKAADSRDDDFQVETHDPRFGAVFDSHEYAIDPTNPRFKATSAMQTLLEEGRKKRKHAQEADGDDVVASRVKKTKAHRANATSATGDDINGLVARLKGKGGNK